MTYKFYRNGGKNNGYRLQDSERPMCVIFAEGEAEALFLEMWLLNLGKIPSDIAVICFKGQTRLPTIFKTIADDENFPHVTNLGFFLDAEQIGVTSKLQSIESIMRQNNLLNVGEHLVIGHQSISKIVNLAIYISPDNCNNGFIEDTVINEVSRSNLSASISALKTSAQQVLSNPVSNKSLVTAYIGLRNPGLCGTQRGFESRVLDVMHPAYNGIRSTLNTII